MVKSGNRAPLKTSVKVITATLITLIVCAVVFYFALPVFNLYSQEFWGCLFLTIALWGIIYTLLSAIGGAVVFNNRSVKITKNFKGIKWIVIVAAIPLAVLILGNIISSTFFNAEKYYNLIEVNESKFEDDMPETDTVTNIALMDSQSATIIGNRTLGALSNVVSQFQVDSVYSQITYKGVPVKAANLEYVDFFKWFNNRDTGIPGYVEVDPVNSDAKYVEFSKPMKYVRSAYFSEDLLRKLRFSYPTKIFDEITFELDESGNPFYIVSCMKPRIGIFGAMDVNEVIIFNPVDGSSEIYSVADTPTWVDNVFNGDLATQKYNWHGMLKNGFWNSIIGNKDCKVTTDDFGYIILGDDVWYFTGVTSISSDLSNIGFIVSNARTGEYKFYPVIGAEEHSAMSAAQGEVQEKGYVASFPSLINVSGEATYIMVLKDSGGIVKLIALVNVENYSIVATGSTQTEAKEEYIKLLVQNGIIEETEEITPPPVVENTKTVEITVADITERSIDGTSVIYFKDENGILYKQSLSNDESIMLIGKGDKIKVVYLDTEIDRIKQMVSFEESK